MKRLLSIMLFCVLGFSGKSFALPPCPTSGVFDNCFGTYTFDDGTKYVGEWKDDEFHGQGTYTYAEGDKYVGEWKDNNMHGRGTMTYLDGDKYVGEWKDNNMHGRGTFTYADNGDRFVGRMENDNPWHGIVTLGQGGTRVFIGGADCMAVKGTQAFLETPGKKRARQQMASLCNKVSGWTPNYWSSASANFSVPMELLSYTATLLQGEECRVWFRKDGESYSCSTNDIISIGGEFLAHGFGGLGAFDCFAMLAGPSPNCYKE